MIRNRVMFLLLAAMTLAGCDDTLPTAVDSQLDAAAFELVAEQALEVSDKAGTPLPSLDHLLRRTWQAIREYDGHGEGVRLLRAGRTLQGIISVLGPEVAAESLHGVRAALDEINAHMGDKVPPDHVKKALNKAEAQWARGVAALAAGNPAAALGAALDAAHWVRSLSPRYRARTAIQRATRALNAAVAVVGDGPNESEKALLGKAAALRKQALEAFRANRYRKAWGHAQESFGLSLQVLKGRSG